jgi:hypothetical protein
MIVVGFDSVCCDVLSLVNHESHHLSPRFPPPAISTTSAVCHRMGVGNLLVGAAVLLLLLLLLLFRLLQLLLFLALAFVFVQMLGKL